MNRWRILSVFIVLASGLASTGIAARPAAAACVAPPAVDVPVSRVVDTGFVPISPIRVADTRTGVGVALGPIADGCVARVGLAAASPPPAATAVALTITSDRADRAGYITAYGCGSSRPTSSSLNPRPNDPTPNLLVVALDPTGEICFYSDHTTDLIVDVTGWFTPTGDPFHEITPLRALDTRNDVGQGLPVAAATTMRIPIAGVTVPVGASAVAATVTLTQAGAATYATAFPCGAAVPATSTTNTLAGRDRGTAALVGLGTDGALCVFVSAAAHLLVDITGWFGDDSSALAAVPGSPLAHLATRRVADSRNPGSSGLQRLAAGVERRVEVLDAVPVGTTSVQLNLLAINPQANGFLSAYPCGTRSTTSALNYPRGGVETALVTVALGADGGVCLTSSAATDYVVDLFAAFGAPGSLHALRASPAIDQGVQPGQLDHTLHCPVGGATIPFSIQPAPGISVSIDAGPAALGVQSATRPLAADGAVAVRLSGRGVDEQHLIRCLPSDFPRLAAQGTAATPGWYVATSLGAAGFAFILDQYGVPVWYQRTRVPMIGVWALADGTLAWREWTGGGFPGGNGTPESPPRGFEIHNLAGDLVDTIDPVGGTEPLDWHELLELPGGGHLVVTYPIRDTGVGRNCTRSTGGSIAGVTRVVDNDLVELDAAGAEVWRWESEDHTLLSEGQLPICFQIAANPALSSSWALDYMHLNSVDRFANGDYLIAARHFNSIERIDRATSNVVWKLGGTAPLTGTPLDVRGLGGASATPGERPAGPHDARISPTGTITVHDNHLGGASRASEYRIEPSGTTATLIWQFLSPNAAGATLGSVRRQTDGSTVIAWGEGHAPWLEDVGAGGTVALRIDLTTNELIYRGIKVPANTWTRDQLRAAAGAPPTDRGSQLRSEPATHR